MPKRMLDDSLLTSASLAKCSPRAQDAFPRFILLADDFGCFEVIPRALAAKGWVYRQDVTEADMVAWLEEYVAAGMACLWTQNERRYCHLIGWNGPHGQRQRAEYDPNAPKGTPGAHGSKRRTPRPPADLVAAVAAGVRRDRDGKPPGVEAFPGGNAAGDSNFPGGNTETANPNEITPARESAGEAREIRGSAAPVPVPVPVPDPEEALPLACAREAGAMARTEVLAGMDETFARKYPRTDELLRACAAAGVVLAWPKAGAGRAAAEAAIGDQPVSVIVPRVAASVAENGKPWLGWHLDALRGTARTSYRASAIAAPAPHEAFGAGGERVIE